MKKTVLVVAFAVASMPVAFAQSSGSAAQAGSSAGGQNSTNGSAGGWKLNRPDRLGIVVRPRFNGIWFFVSRYVEKLNGTQW